MFLRNSNSRQEVNLNTNLYTSYSEYAQLIAGAWNKSLSIQLKPCVGKDANGLRQYAEEKSQIINTSISPENAICLLKGFEKEVVPALNGDRESGSASIIISTNDARKILTIGYDGKNAYLTIAVGVNESGIASASITHIFNKRSYLTNYVSTDGTCTEIAVESDFLSFIEKVSSVKDLSPTIAHSIRYNELVRSAYQRTSSSTGHQNNTQQTYSAPVSNVNSMDDFLPFV